MQKPINEITKNTQKSIIKIDADQTCLQMVYTILQGRIRHGLGRESTPAGFQIAWLNSTQPAVVLVKGDYQAALRLLERNSCLTAQTKLVNVAFEFFSAKSAITTDTHSSSSDDDTTVTDTTPLLSSTS